MNRLPYLCLPLAALLFVGCSKNEPPENFSSDEPATFVGSPSCQACHDAEYQDWLGSHHELAMQIATADTVLGDFDDVSLDYYGSDHKILHALR